MANKITYGLSNAHVWPILSTSAAGVPTYGNVINLPGSTALTLDAEGSSDPFYADDVVYYQGTANNGYTGSITLADVPLAFLTDIMGEVRDSNGALIENSDVQPKEFAIAFEFKGDASKRRFLFYRCKATRPSVASATKEDSITPNTSELSFSAMPRLDNSNVKAKAEETDTAYAEWYGSAPYEPNVSYSYVAVEDPGEASPILEGWYELSGTTYVLSEDAEVDETKTYYKRTAG
jgi:phi13 family phage major tail protein